jgi:hypothetical protein
MMFLPLFFHRRPKDNVVNDKGDGATDDNDDNSVGATDDNVHEDGDRDGATDDDGDCNGLVDNDDDDDNDGDNNSDGAADDDNDVNDDDDNNLPPRVGKRNDGCDETKTEEEETVTDSVEIHTTIKQITGRGGGRW